MRLLRGGASNRQFDDDQCDPKKNIIGAEELCFSWGEKALAVSPARKQARSTKKTIRQVLRHVFCGFVWEPSVMLACISSGEHPGPWGRTGLKTWGQKNKSLRVFFHPRTVSALSWACCEVFSPFFPRVPLDLFFSVRVRRFMRSEEINSIYLSNSQILEMT